MMNVKESSHVCGIETKIRQPWNFFCASFKRLSTISDVIKSSRRSPGVKRIKKLTCLTSEAFVVKTETNILAEQHLLTEYKFDYVFLVINATDSKKKFFCQTRQRMAGSFYIDLVDGMATATMQVLQQLLKLNIDEI